jgi:muconolactone delta-isomerase
MQAPCVPETFGRYFVELTPPKRGFDDIQALAARARAASERLSRHGTRVRLLRSVFVPDSGTCFLLYEADSAEAVSQAAAEAEVDASRVVPTLKPAQAI